MAYKNKGFTIVELMIAISVFATAMTLVLAGVIFISRQYQQTSNRVALEDASRTVHQQIANSIQFSIGQGIKDVTVTPYKATCIGNLMYIYGSLEPINDLTAYNSANHPSGLFLKENINNCDSAQINTTNASNLLPIGAKVTQFDVNETTGSIHTVFVKSDSDLLSSPESPGVYKCDSSKKGREFCATVEFKSSATRRVGN